jgi:hypothetical protein
MAKWERLYHERLAPHFATPLYWRWILIAECFPRSRG